MDAVCCSESEAFGRPPRARHEGARQIILTETLARLRSARGERSWRSLSTTRAVRTALNEHGGIAVLHEHRIGRQELERFGLGLRYKYPVERVRRVQRKPCYGRCMRGEHRKLNETAGCNGSRGFVRVCLELVRLPGRSHRNEASMRSERVRAAGGDAMATPDDDTAPAGVQRQRRAISSSTPPTITAAAHHSQAVTTSPASATPSTIAMTGLTKV